MVQSTQHQHVRVGSESYVGSINVEVDLMSFNYHIRGLHAHFLEECCSVRASWFQSRLSRTRFHHVATELFTTTQRIVSRDSTVLEWLHASLRHTQHLLWSLWKSQRRTGLSFSNFCISNPIIQSARSHQYIMMSMRVAKAAVVFLNYGSAAKHFLMVLIFGSGDIFARRTRWWYWNERPSLFWPDSLQNRAHGPTRIWKISACGLSCRQYHKGAFCRLMLNKIKIRPFDHS